jgi:three-Cys-motif partner protein
MPGKLNKSDDEFFDESISFFLEKGKQLQLTDPDIVDEYNDHSILKLIAIEYWVGFFAPIAHRQLKEKYGYQVVYIDTMAGSGVTMTKRAGDYFCGSCPGALISAERSNFPFDKVIGVEIDNEKSRTLQNRLKRLSQSTVYQIYSEDIDEVSQQIADELQKMSVSYIVVDPHAIKGLSWKALKPLLECKGDIMFTWFEDKIWRVRAAALSNGISAKADAARLTELLGNEDWREAKSSHNLTDIFIRRVLNETKKCAVQSLDIEDKEKIHYKMILFVGRCRNAQLLADQWKTNMEKRLGSDQGIHIAHILDRKTGRTSDLRDYGLKD